MDTLGEQFDWERYADMPPGADSNPNPQPSTSRARLSHVGVAGVAVWVQGSGFRVQGSGYRGCALDSDLGPVVRAPGAPNLKNFGLYPRHVNAAGHRQQRLLARC